MYEFAPLSLSDVSEAMIRVELLNNENSVFVCGSFFELVNPNADKLDYRNRYSKVPFYIKNIEHSELSNLNDFSDLIVLFCNFYQEEKK